MKKLCKTCGIDRFMCEFYNSSSSKDGLCGFCKKCDHNRKLAYKRTKKGLAFAIFYQQIGSSKPRMHESPTYTKHDLLSWLNKSDKFHELFDKWVESGYKKDLRPSVDRPDDYKGYSMGNIQVMTWGDNRYKHYHDRVNGINNKTNRAVVQMSMSGDFINEFHSLQEAYRKTGACNLSQVCKGVLPYAGGFTWKFKNN